MRLLLAVLVLLSIPATAQVSSYRVESAVKGIPTSVSDPLIDGQGITYTDEAASFKRRLDVSTPVTTIGALGNFLVCLGSVPGFGCGTVASHSPAIKTTEEDIWRPGGIMEWPTTATTIEIVSTDVDDTTGGTGCQLVQINGLDVNFDEQSEFLAPNGTTPVNTVNTYSRFQNAICVLAGSSMYNEGDIDVFMDSGKLQARLGEGTARTQRSHYTVPNDRLLFIHNGVISVENGKGATVRFKFMAGGTNVWTTGQIFQSSDAGIQFNDVFPIPLPEKTDIVITADTATGNANIGALYNYVLITAVQ